MRVTFEIAPGDVERFSQRCEAIITNVGKGTKEATIEAVSDILFDALSQVPVDTGTLAASIYGGTYNRADVKSYLYGGVVGFGDPSGIVTEAIEWIREPNNGINTKSGKLASEYAMTVHEDLDMPHRNGGKAKFLEDPVRSYNDGKLLTVAAKHWGRAISSK